MKSSEKKNTFVEDEKIINEDESNAVFLNLFFFSNALKNLKIAEFRIE